ncbi:3-keto-5-aminohexanoate cleavage protein [Pseudoroseicyclus sp. CXY001]|uniref:3-keto-5-aminohexanoate cleavage protein n=1 Tax=Pseudoroseicyclus sp. CXY001 TaxID=3242492 RepID=UPI00358DC248
MSLPRLMVAPNGARRGKADHPALPVTIPEIVETARAAQASGADGIHAHARDADGRHSLDPVLCRELLAALGEAVPGMHLQLTSEAAGRYAPAEQIAAMQAIRPASLSVALREVSPATPEGVDFYRWCAAEGLFVQHILYAPQELAALGELLRLLPEPATPPAVIYVLGAYAPARDGTPAELGGFLKSAALLPQKLDWMVCAFGRTERDCLAAALTQGGKVRVGFENNIHRPDGALAGSNDEQVARIAGLMRQSA